MIKYSAFYYLTVRHGRRFAEMYLALGDDAAFSNRLAKALLSGAYDCRVRGYRRTSIMDRCYWEQRQKHKSKRKWAKK